jgi:hypothetical protein
LENKIPTGPSANEVIEILDDIMEVLEEETAEVTISLVMSLFATVYMSASVSFQKAMRDAVVEILKRAESEKLGRAH